MGALSMCTSRVKGKIRKMVSPYQTFILAAVVRDAVQLMSARTSGRCKILMIPSRNIRDTFEHDAAFARAIVSELGGRYRGMVKALKNQKLHQEAEQGGNGQLTLPVEKRALASLLGMTPENLSRAFGTLAPYGVEVDGAVVNMTKPKDLATLAKQNPLIDDPAS